MTAGEEIKSGIIFIWQAEVVRASAVFAEQLHVELTPCLVHQPTSITLAAIAQPFCFVRSVYFELGACFRKAANLFTMRFSTSAVLVTMLGWIGATTAHNIQLKAHSRECFHEKLHRDDKMTVTFQVGDREFGGSGNLEIDFWVRAKPLFCGCSRSC